MKPDSIGPTREEDVSLLLQAVLLGALGGVLLALAGFVLRSIF